jgi:hypothetical protein
MPRKRLFESARKREVLRKGFTCECGVTHGYTAYVYAHWDESLTHTCECGREHRVLRGRATLVS